MYALPLVLSDINRIFTVANTIFKSSTMLGVGDVQSNPFGAYRRGWYCICRIPGVACPIGLGLKAEGGLGHFFAVLGSDLRAEEPVKASSSGLGHRKTRLPKNRIGGIFSDILQ